MDGKILDQVSVNTVGNCKMYITDAIKMENYKKYTLPVPFTPYAVMCAKNHAGDDYSAVLVKPMAANQIMEVVTWGDSSVEVRTSYGGDWYFVFFG